ncbi:MAG: ABC transporter ATP-binding protein/permease, partial [Propionibacteriaceae bacterium]|nr:ABC transporter ATP-binding protein/permease [Propionibacteriaceae bacterium]
DNISTSIASTTTQLVSAVLTILGSLGVMLFLSPPLTIAVVVSVPLVAALTNTIAKRSRAYFLSQQRNLGLLNGAIEENIVGMKMVKAFGRRDYVMQQFGQTNEKLYGASLRAQIWSGFMMPLMNVINNLIYTLVAITGGVLSISYGLPVGTVVSFLFYSKQFGQPLNSIAGMWNTIQQALAGAERVFEILDQPEETPDVPNAIDEHDVAGRVAFHDVCFSYPTAGQPEKLILKHISFDVSPGETIALVGETGAGKTTIVNLLLRFYDANTGQILIDDVPITDIVRDSLRRCFSVVLQDTCLFTGTILDNIAYSRPDATQAEVIAAAKLAHADEFIEKLPHGYQTAVSGSSDNLSEGQRQLLAIARAVLGNSPILILDEATSSVDTKTEKDIQRALLQLMSNHTSFLIAHRLSTIRDADRIMVIGDGQILESGNHAQLMAHQGQYYEMVVSQMGVIQKPPVG